MPIVLVGRSFGCRQSDHAVLLVRVSNVGLVEESFKGVLVLSARLVGNLDATPALARVLKEVNVGTLVESVMPGPHILGAVKVMNISEESSNIFLSWTRRHLEAQALEGFSTAAASITIE